MSDIDYSKVELQDAATADSAEVDYELHRISDSRWEILAITYGRRAEQESLVATLPNEEAAKIAWEQVMTCMNADRGVLYFASQTPSWELKWLDEEAFEIRTDYTRSSGLKNESVMVWEEEGTPFRVREVPIEHWTENPLFAADKPEGK